MKQRGSSLVRRKLDFKEKPFNDKTFYLDVRSENVKNKVARRIKELGGRIEGFLTKEVHLLITDKTKNDINQDKTSRKEFEELSPSNLQSNSINVPLSRGRALMLKATQQKQNNRTKNGNDVVHNASLLGVKVEQVSLFLKDSRKLWQEIKQLAGGDDTKIDDFDGISPLKWKDFNKENRNILKIEDASQLFKPMLKHLDDFPLVRYSDQLVSPFDKGVTLCKKSESKPHRYSTKTKLKVKVHKGGFCEACDYWYKCSLREHLNSEKHQKFVREAKNFENLDVIISKMPSLNDFIGKYAPTINSVKASYKKCNDKDGLPEKVCSGEMDLILTRDTEIQVCDKVDNYDGTNTEDFKMDIDILLPAVLKVSVGDDSMDSGTGPDLLDTLSRDSIACDDIKETKSKNFKRSNSDSALPPDVIEDNDQDVVMQSCSTNLHLQESNCDNAMFMCIPKNDKSENVPIDQATSNVRKRLSSFSIQGSNGNSERKTPQGFHNLIPTYSADTEEYMPVLRDMNSNIATNDKVSELDIPLVHKARLSPEIGEENQEDLHYDSDTSDYDMPTIDKFEFSPQKSDSSNKNSKFLDIASHWMNDIHNQDSVKKVECSELPSTISFSKDSNFILNSSESCPERSKCAQSQQNVPSKDKSTSLDDRKTVNKAHYLNHHVNTAMYSDISVSEKSENIFPSIRNPFSFQNSDIDTCDSESSNISIKSSSNSFCKDVSSRSSFDVSSNQSLPEFEENPEKKVFEAQTPRNPNGIQTPETPVLMNTPKSSVVAGQTPKTPGSGFFRPWMCITESGNKLYTDNSESKQKSVKLKFNLTAADMGSLLKEVKKSTCKKKKVTARRKDIEQNMKDNKNNKIIYSCQQNGTKLKLCKVSVTPVQHQNDLHSYWKIRKSSECGLVFSANKRKLEDNGNHDNNQKDHDSGAPVQKRRRCLAF